VGDENGQRALRILLADQDPGALKITAQQVRQLGHTPTEIAVSLSEAADSIARDDPDLTIVVIYGDDEPALDLIEEIAAFSSGPVIALLDREDSQFVAQAAERGIFAYARQQTADSIQSAGRSSSAPRASSWSATASTIARRSSGCASTPAAPTARWSTWPRRWPKGTRCCPGRAIRSIRSRSARGTLGQPNPGVRRGPSPRKGALQ
jgi:DNA-binding NarL/FixJ family response regulator